MKKKIMIVISLALLLTVSACSNQPKSTADTPLKKDQKAFAWWTDREKQFGEYDYPITEEEVNETIEKKFNLKLLPSFDEAIKVTKDILNEKEGVEFDEVFNVLANGKQLQFINKLRFTDKEGANIANSQIRTTYLYMDELKKVKIASQDITILAASGESSIFTEETLESLLQQLGEIFEIKDLSKEMETFKKETADSDKLSKKSVVIYSDVKTAKEERSFGKYLQVLYDANGEPEKIFAGTEDYRR
jgi:hypothetical protein